mmetsp:Transcript_7646/g.11690  ORF Transcript_7646/g.11690 Transcript_7646/m.11690 type:complete len:298 (+) Transcript_7646:187-1080(+)
MSSKSKDDLVPQQDDVLLGRAADVFHHPGNARYRHLITMNLHTFQLCQDRLDKMNLIKQVTLQIMDGGRVRFLRQHEKHRWKEVTFRTAYDKVSHALRDGIKKTVFPTVKPAPPKPPAPAPPLSRTTPTYATGFPTDTNLLLRRAQLECQQLEFERQQQQQQQQQANDSNLLFQRQLQSLLGGLQQPDPTTAMLSRNLTTPSFAYQSLPSLPADFVPPNETPLQESAFAEGSPIRGVYPRQNVRVPVHRRPQKDLGLNRQPLIPEQKSPTEKRDKMKKADSKKLAGDALKEYTKPKK